MTGRRNIWVLALALSAVLWQPVMSAQISDPLIIGVFPRRNAKHTIKLFKPLANYLQERLGRPVKLETSADFNSFWQGVSTQRYDLVHFNQYHYVRSHKKLGYSVIAMNEEFGKSKIAAVITVKKDAGIKSLQDLKGKKIIFGGGPKAMMSYILPKYLLTQAGLKEGDYQEDFAKNPPNAILAVYYGQASAAGAGDIVVEMPAIKSKCDIEKFTYLEVSEPLSHLPWAVKPAMKVDERKRIQKILVGMKETKEGRLTLEKAKLTGLLPATDQDYDKHRKIIESVLGEKY